MYIQGRSSKLILEVQDFYTVMATKVQSHPIDTAELQEGFRIDSSERQVTETSSLWSPLVWRDVLRYLRDLLLRNVTVGEFLWGLSIGLMKEIQRSRGRIEYPEEDKIIIFSGYEQNFLLQQSADDRGDDSPCRLNVSAPDVLFIQLRAAARTLANELERAEIISSVEQLEKSKGTPDFLQAYQTFIASIAAHRRAFGSFVPSLTKMLSENEPAGL
jgi:hypothetical protein